jgi:MOSC domain-containing protein YiiM
MPARVIALHRKLPEGGVEAVDFLEAVGGRGFVGDRTFGKRTRQALLISTESLDELGFAPGELREQVAVDLPGLQAVTPGTRVRAGEVEFQIEQDCAPCTHMAAVLGEDPENFKRRASFKRGMLALVLTDGVVRVGDEVSVVGEG